MSAGRAIYARSRAGASGRTQIRQSAATGSARAISVIAEISENLLSLRARVLCPV